LVTISDVSLGHLLAGALHQFKFNLVLNLLHGHSLVTGHTDAVSDLMNQSLVFTHFGLKHRFTDCGLDFFIIIADYAPVTLNYGLYHLLYF
jgi:hypothetical protein